MNVVTQDQFNDAMSRIFLRFDQMDEKLDRQYRQLRAMVDRDVSDLDEFKHETRTANENMNDRIIKLETWRNSYAH